MTKFTLLEIHLDNVDIDGTADAVTALPFSSLKTGEPEEAQAEAEPLGDESDGGRASLAPVLVLVGVIVLAVVLKKVLGGGTDE